MRKSVFAGTVTILLSGIASTLLLWFSARLPAVAILVLVAMATGMILIQRAYRRAAEEWGEMKGVIRSAARGDFSRRAPLAGAEVGVAVNEMIDELSTRWKVAREETAKLEAVLAGMREGVMAVDSSGKIVRTNLSARALFGLRDEAVGIPVWEAVRSAAMEEWVRIVLEEGKSLEERIEIGDRTLEITVCSVAERRGVVFVARDVTERVRYEAQRREFVANVSHELRTPVALIRGFLETLEEGAIRDPERGPEFLRTIRKHVQRLDNIVADLLDLSRLEGRPGSRKEVRVDAGSTAGKVMEALRPEAEKRRQTLEAPRAAERVEIVGDPEYLERAITNLVENAIRYTPEEGRIDVRVRREGEDAIVEVEDNGIGIPAKDLPNIFERFYRVDKSRSREGGGTGLGLSIVKHVALALGGRVDVRSEVGKGSVFRLILPAAPR